MGDLSYYVLDYTSLMVPLKLQIGKAWSSMTHMRAGKASCCQQVGSGCFPRVSCPAHIFTSSLSCRSLTLFAKSWNLFKHLSSGVGKYLELEEFILLGGNLFAEVRKVVQF